MNEKEMIAEMDHLTDALCYKAVSEPMTSVHAYNGGRVAIFMLGKGLGSYDTKVVSGSDCADAISKAWEFVNGLKSGEERNAERFTRAVADLIDLGKECGQSVDVMNPLTEMMKRLSESALEDKRHD